MTMSAAEAPSPEEHWACQLAHWYPIFSAPFPHRKKGLTFPSRILSDNNNDALRLYLTQDGVRLPANTKPSSCLGCKPQQQTQGSFDDDDDEQEDNWSDDSSLVGAEDDKGNDNAITAADHHDLDELTHQITESIRELGGTVIPKLNWSAPKDASWMNEGTLKCSTAGDVYLLLKSSDFCSSDLNLIESLQQQHPQTTTTTTTQNKNGNNVKLQLVLRKWANLFPSQEFRCFVKDKRLIAVSQRHADQHFEHLPQEKDELLGLLEDFFAPTENDNDQNNNNNDESDVCIINKFPLSSFVVDVYIDRKDQVWIVDFNVWGERTDSLLFDWTELQSTRATTNHQPCKIRVIETEKQVLPHSLNDFRAPVDTVHIASITNGNADSFQAFMDLCRTQEQEEEEEDDG